MHAVDLWSAAVPDDTVPDLPDTPAPGLCAVTGAVCDTIAARHLLSASFTAWARLSVPSSDRVGVAVWRAWQHGERREGKSRDYQPERMSSWIVTAHGLRLLDRAGVRDAVLSPPPDQPWAGYATTSYKKHGTLYAPVNGRGRAVWGWDEVAVDCSDAAQLRACWDAMRGYQDAGIPRPVIQTGAVDEPLARKVGLETALRFARWSAPIVASAQYQFLAYLLPSVEELKEIAADVPPAPRPLATGEQWGLS